jgi:hypothetical protein
MNKEDDEERRTVYKKNETKNIANKCTLFIYTFLSTKYKKERILAKIAPN